MKKKVVISIIIVCLLIAAIFAFGFMGKMKDRPPKERPPQGQEVGLVNTEVFYN